MKTKNYTFMINTCICNYCHMESDSYISAKGLAFCDSDCLAAGIWQNKIKISDGLLAHCNILNKV